MDVNEKNYLFAFDMDFTILDKNTDYEIRDLLTYEDQLEILNKNLNSWGDLVNVFFMKFKANNISIEKIEERIKRIPLTPGMHKLFDYIRKLKLSGNTKVDCIVVSGANILYCKWILEENKLNDIINNFYSFDCKEIDGRLEIGTTHKHECKYCDILMCKSKAIQEHIIRTQSKDFKYHKICYFGDGGNDYCPGLNISTFPLFYTSYLFVRKGYELHKKLYDKNNEPSDLCKNINSKVILWNDGFDLLERLKFEIE